MPRIFDNIDQRLVSAIQETLAVSDRADFCVGYFNLRGWKKIDESVERWSGGPGSCCRLLVGMNLLPWDEMRRALQIVRSNQGLDNQTAIRLKKELAREFREQLTIGVPNNADEAGLRRLAAQLREKKVVVKVHLRHPLHAKLYLLFRPDRITPTVGYLGSSNLTLAGLCDQGELNIDVVDQDACNKLAAWFEARWNDQWCLDISKELLEIIEESWAGEPLRKPHHVYLKVAWHLAEEARTGVREFRLPRDFDNKLFKFQEAAVKIAAQKLSKSGGVLIGDVVGLGKTLMATALARLFEELYDLETLILCPKNLVSMWEHHREHYRLRGKVLATSLVSRELPELRRYRLVLIDESHNLRNREGKRYRLIQVYIQKNGSKVILLSATPYNKTYIDLSTQLRLFVPEDQDVGVRPERYLREISETEFIKRHQCGPRTLAAFEKSPHADDWRELMRLYLVRRTRSFIHDNYGILDPATGRRYLEFPDGTRQEFPERIPKTIRFPMNSGDPNDQYGLLYSDPIVDAVNRLSLPRYGLGNYIDERPDDPPTAAEARVIADLSRAGKRLMGFCRTNLFKRLESGGQAFLQSVERHILRNFVYLHALDQGLPVPIGTQDIVMLDTRFHDDDVGLFAGEDDEEDAPDDDAPTDTWTPETFRREAETVYAVYSGRFRRRFRWLPASRFIPRLREHLLKDCEELLGILAKSGAWRPEHDVKLKLLMDLITRRHPHEKILIFTQFADTVAYLAEQLESRGVAHVAGVTGHSTDPTKFAFRFSPVSNNKRGEIAPEDEVHVLIATDVLSEGQNLQDAAIVVNYDLPWAIIRLIQRAGRVDRIGQKASRILCHTFLPADGVEQIIRLRARVRQRLKENAEVVGTDEAFFEDDDNSQVIRDLFTEKAGSLDGDADNEIDLVSRAYQIWKNAIDRDPSLVKLIEDMPNVVYATKPHVPAPGQPGGVVAYVRTAEGNDALAWLDSNDRPVTESQFAILNAIECVPETPALPRQENHHELVHKAVELIAAEDKSAGGQLGRPSGARFKTYERLKRHTEEVKGTLFDTPQLRRAFEDIHNFPLRQVATDILNRLIRSHASDADLAQRVIDLREEGRLSIIDQNDQSQEPQIICSLGLAERGRATQ